MSWDDTTTAGGWRCPNCGVLVPWYLEHECHEGDFELNWTTYEPDWFHITGLLERIVELLEEMGKSG